MPYVSYQIPNYSVQLKPKLSFNLRHLIKKQRIFIDYMLQLLVLQCLCSLQYCAGDGECCSTLQIGQFSTPLGSQAQTVSMGLSYPYLLVPRAIFALSYLQYSKPIQNNLLRLSFTARIQASRLLLQDVSMPNCFSYLIEFTYMVTIKPLVVMSQNLLAIQGIDNYYLNLVPQGQSVNNACGSCFIVGFRIDIGNSYLVGLKLHRVQLVSQTNQARIFSKNPGYNNIKTILINCVYLNLKKFNSSYENDRLLILAGYRSQVYTINQNTRSLLYYELYNQLRTFVPGSAVVGLLGFVHDLGSKTLSIGFSVNSSNNVITASFDKNNYPLQFPDSLDCTLYVFNLFAIYQYSCTAPQVLSPNRTACLNWCPILYFSNPCRRCLSCSPNCITCSARFNCLSCYPGTLKSVSTVNCQCPSGYFDPGPPYSVCRPCHPTCQRCAAPTLEDLCLECDEAERVLAGLRCVCRAGLLQSQLHKCSSCATVCLTCTLSAELCTSCSPSAFLVNIFNRTTCIACGQNQSYVPELQSCFCNQNYSLVRQTCTLYGIGSDQTSQAFFFQQSQTYSLLARSQGLIFFVGQALGLNSLFLDLMADQQLLKLHSVSNFKPNLILLAAFSVLYFDQPLHFMRQAEQRFKKAVLPVNQVVLPETRLYFQQQFQAGRFLISNLFGTLTSLLTLLLNISILLLFKALLLCYLKCNFYCCIKFTVKLRKFIRMSFGNLPFRVFVLYLQSSLVLHSKALAMVMMRPSSFSIFWQANIFCSYLVTCTFFVVILRSYAISSNNIRGRLRYLLIFDSRLKRKSLLHSLCYFFYCAKFMTLPCILFLSDNVRLQMLFLVVYHLVLIYLFSFVKLEVKNYLTTQLRHLLFAILQTIIFALELAEHSPPVKKALSYLGVAAIAAVVLTSVVVLAKQLVKKTKEIIKARKRTRVVGSWSRSNINNLKWHRK